MSGFKFTPEDFTFKNNYGDAVLIVARKSADIANAKVASLVEELRQIKENVIFDLQARIEELEHVPDNISSMSEGKRLVCMLKADREKSKALIHALRMELVKVRTTLAFYADRENWVSRSGKIGVTPVWSDLGSLAKKALKGEG